VDFFCYVCDMYVVMVEKTLSGYKKGKDSIFWENGADTLHKKHGPAIMYESGVWTWYNHGYIVKSINVEDDDVQIKEILEEINFEKICKMMNSVGWTWRNDPVTVKILMQGALRFLDRAKQYRNSDEMLSVESGGFKASACKTGFKLEFTIDSWDTSDFW
jgi:hypothetical protein